MAEPAESMAGVIVQAQALQAWGTVPLLDQVLATVADKEGVWATRFAGTHRSGCRQAVQIVPLSRCRNSNRREQVIQPRAAHS